MLREEHECVEGGRSRSERDKSSNAHHPLDDSGIVAFDVNYALRLPVLVARSSRGTSEGWVTKTAIALSHNVQLASSRLGAFDLTKVRRI